MRFRLISVIFVILFSFATPPAAHAQEVVYLIRHAEQMQDVEDPPLTDAGHQRAKVWLGILRDAGIKVVYTSKKRRTKQTGEPIAQALNIPLEAMKRRDVAGLVDRLRTRHADDAALIVSHSRMIPKLLKELGHLEDVTIDLDDYGNLFIIVPQSESNPLVLRLRYP
jgi:phosphohistidine phosphatase SixA